MKQSMTRPTAGSRRKWDQASFFSDARAKLSPEELGALETLFEQAGLLGCEITWGTGSKNASFGVIEPAACARSLLTVYSQGLLRLNFGWTHGTELAERARERLAELVVQEVGLEVPDNYRDKNLGYPIAEWASKVASLVDVLKRVVSEARAAAS